MRTACLARVWLASCLLLQALAFVSSASAQHTAFKASPQQAEPDAGDATLQVLDMAVPGINFLQRFTVPCWQMDHTWMETEGLKTGSDPWPTLPLERLVIGQRFYAAGLQAYNSSDWHTAADNLATALHLQLYPYLGSMTAMRAWQRALASSDAGSVAIRAWTGQLLIAYAKAQYSGGRARNDIHAADLGYSASEAAVAILNSVMDIMKSGSRHGLELNFQKDVNEFAAELAEAQRLQRLLASTVAELVSRGRKPELVQALLPRRGHDRSMKSELEMIGALGHALKAPIKVLCCGDATTLDRNGIDAGVSGSSTSGSSTKGGGGIYSGVPHAIGNEAVIEGLTIAWRGVPASDAVHAAAVVAVHAVRDGLRREVGVECWDSALGHPDMLKCSDYVRALWRDPINEAEMLPDVPSPSSLLSSLQLLQAAMLQLNQVLPGTALGMKHESGAVIVKNPGFQWRFMDFFFAQKLAGGTGEVVSSAASVALAPPGTPAGTPGVCIDYSMLQNSLLLLNETSLTDLSGALQGLLTAQAKVGGPLPFWEMVSAGRKTPTQYQDLLATAMESAASPGAREEIASRLNSVSLEGLDNFDMGLPVPKKVPATARGGKFFSSLFVMTLDDAALSLALLLCLVGAVSLYRALTQLLTMHLRRARAGRGKVARPSTGPSAEVITQRAAATTALREALASENLARLSAAVKTAEEAGVEKLLVKKGKNAVHALKKRKVAALGGPLDRKNHNSVSSPTARSPLSPSARFSPTPPYHDRGGAYEQPLSPTSSLPSRGPSQPSTPLAKSQSAPSTATAASAAAASSQDVWEFSTSGGFAAFDPGKEERNDTKILIDDDDWTPVLPHKPTTSHATDSAAAHAAEPRGAKSTTTNTAGNSSYQVAAAAEGNRPQELQREPASNSKGLDKVSSGKPLATTGAGTPLRSTSGSSTSSNEATFHHYKHPQTPPPAPLTSPGKRPTARTTPADIPAMPIPLGASRSPVSVHASSSTMVVQKPPPPPPPPPSTLHNLHGTIPPPPRSQSASSTPTKMHHSRSVPGRVGGASSLPDNTSASGALASGSTSASSSSASLKGAVGNASNTVGIPRTSSLPSRGGLHGVEIEKPETLQGKQAPKVVLVKRSSLQRPPPAPGTQQATATTKTKVTAPKPPKALPATTTKPATAEKVLGETTLRTTLAVKKPASAAVLGPSTPADVPAATVTFSNLSPISTSPRSLPCESLNSPLAALIGTNDGPKVPEWVAQATAAWPSAPSPSSLDHLPPPSVERIIDEVGISDAWAAGTGHLASGGSLGASLGPAFSPPLGGFATRSLAFAHPSSLPYDPSSSKMGGLSPDTSLGLALMPSEPSLGLSTDGGSSLGLGASRLSMRTTSLPSDELLASLQHIWGSAGGEDGNAAGQPPVAPAPAAGAASNPQAGGDSLLGLPMTPTIAGSAGGAGWGKLAGGDGRWGLPTFGPLTRVAASTSTEESSSGNGGGGSLADLGFEESCEVE